MWNVLGISLNTYMCMHGFVPAKSLQSCLTLCNPMNCSPPSSTVHEDSRQEYWSGLPCPPPGDLPDPGIEPASLMSLTLAVGFITAVPPGKPTNKYSTQQKLNELE